MKKSDGLHIMVLSVKLNSFRIWVEFLIGQLILEVTFSIDSTGTFAVSTDSPGIAQVGGP